MTKAQFETAKEVMSAINYLEKISEILHNEKDIRIKLSYWSDNNDHMSEIDLGYMDKHTFEAVMENITDTIDKRLKTFNARLEEI